MHRVVRFMPGPKPAVHHIFVCKPGHKLPKQKCGNADEGTDDKRGKSHIYKTEPKYSSGFFLTIRILITKILPVCFQTSKKGPEL